MSKNIFFVKSLGTDNPVCISTTVSVYSLTLRNVVLRKSWYLHKYIISVS